MADRLYWRVHVRVDQDPLSTLTFTCPSAHEDRADVSAEAVRAYAELVGLPEGWTVHVEVSTLTGPDDPQNQPVPFEAFSVATCVRRGSFSRPNADRRVRRVDFRAAS